MKNRIVFVLFAAFAALTFMGCPGTGNPGTGNTGTGPGDGTPKEELPSLADHLKKVESAKFEDYRKQEGFQVQDEANFERMKKHILNHYEGVVVVNSFEMGPNNIIDCIKLETQPSLNTPEMKGHQLATPPTFSEGGKIGRPDQEQEGTPIQAQLSKNDLDRFKNVRYCDEGNIPMRRLTLETLVRFETLDDFFYKAGADGQKQDPVPGEDDYTHYWAHAEQNIDNHGGDSRLNVWKPNAEPGWFSLAQHWYVGGSGSNKQTVEGGWQVAKRKYDNTEPNLFIYSTNANYAPGSGCYNLDCAGFVQTNNAWVLGGKLGPVSTTNGTQYIIRMQWQLYEGNWWLFLKGSGDYIAVGYYPGSYYKGGQMSKFAEEVDYGGEVSSLKGDTKTGQMGSGAFANQGWQKSCYQRTIYYIDLSQHGQWASLGAGAATPSCYTVDLHNKTSGSWATYLYFGGPKCPNP